MGRQAYAIDVTESRETLGNMSHVWQSLKSPPIEWFAVTWIGKMAIGVRKPRRCFEIGRVSAAFRADVGEPAQPHFCNDARGQGNL
jgi:hypothetical protein